MFDAFAVGCGSGFTDTHGQKKRFHDFMAFTTLSSESVALNREFQGSIGFGCHVTITNQPGDCVVDSCVSDVELLSQIAGSANVVLVNDSCDRFHVVFCDFRGMVRSSSLVDVGHIEILDRGFEASSP